MYSERDLIMVQSNPSD